MDDEKYALLKARLEPLVFPYRDALFTQWANLAKTAPFAKLEIAVPQAWPAEFDGSQVLGFPVVRDGVKHPTVREIAA